MPESFMLRPKKRGPKPREVTAAGGAGKKGVAGEELDTCRVVKDHAVGGMAGDMGEIEAEAARMIGASSSIGSDEATGRLRLRGELRDRPSLEPAGFVGEGRVDGWKGTLGWWGERRVWSITRRAMERLGYSKDGWGRGPAPA